MSRNASDASISRLDVQKCVVGIEFAGEHPAKLHALKCTLEPADVRLDLFERAAVLLFGGHLQQLCAVIDSACERVQFGHHRFETGLAPTEVLGALRIAPDVRILQLPQGLFQLLLLAVVVKGTPSGRRRATSCP